MWTCENEQQAQKAREKPLISLRGACPLHLATSTTGEEDTTHCTDGSEGRGERTQKVEVDVEVRQDRRFLQPDKRGSGLHIPSFSLQRTVNHNARQPLANAK